MQVISPLLSWRQYPLLVYSLIDGSTFWLEQCTSFIKISGHPWIQIEVHPEMLKSELNHRFSAPVTLKFDGWPRQIIGHLFCATSSFVHHLQTSVNSNLSYSPETLNSGQNRRFRSQDDLEIWPSSFAWASLSSMLINPENFMMIRWQGHREKCVTDGETYRRTDRVVLRAAWLRENLIMELIESLQSENPR